MTVPNETSYAELSWTGAETTFAPGIRTQDVTHITVGYLDANGQSVALTRNTHYTIARDTSTKVVTITPLALPAAPRTLTFNRRTPATQTVAFTDLSKYTALTHEDLHDIAAFRDAELWHEVTERTSWSPELAAVADGTRIVHQVVDWIGGFGDKPDTGQYIGATGYVTLIADAVDIRGTPGSGSGSGDFSGPASASADGNVLLFNGIGGKTGKDGGSFASLFAGSLLEDETSVAGANPCAIGAATTARILITGGAGDVSFSNAVKRLRIVRFPAGKTLKHNATSLVLIRATDRVTAAGDQGVYISDSSGNWRELFYQPAAGLAIVDTDISTDLITPRMLAAAAVAFGGGAINGKLVWSVAANALTVAVKTHAGADPSVSDPVLVPFRSVTVTDGDVVLRKVTAALSLIVPSTATAGFVSGNAGKLWGFYIDNAGAVELGVINCLSVTSIYPLQGWGIISTTVLDAAADNAHVPYSTTARANVPYRTAGYASWEGTGLAVAGTWDAAPTRNQPAGYGVPLPGTVVQSQGNITGAVATGATNIPNDNTKPQNTEGDQYLSQAITLTSVANLVKIDAQLDISSNTATRILTAALFQDSNVDALSSAQVYAATATGALQPSIKHRMRPGATAATTFKVRAGVESAGGLTLNGASSAGLLNGTHNSFINIEELAA